jgi:hypothetical protein
MSTERVQNRRESIWEVAFPISILNVFGATVLSDGKAFFEKKKAIDIERMWRRHFSLLAHQRRCWSVVVERDNLPLGNRRQHQQQKEAIIIVDIAGLQEGLSNEWDDAFLFLFIEA